MPRVTDFLKQYSNYSTMNNHRGALRDFFTSIYEKETSLDKLDITGDRYFIEDRDVQDDIIKFLDYIRGNAPLTQRQKISSIRTFFIDNDIELSQKFWKRLRKRIKGSRALTLDKVPSNEELRRILNHLPIQGKALYLLLSSSGMRIGEALGLAVDDIAFAEDLVKIQIRGELTKTGNSRHAFASRETKEAVQEWLKVRSQYLEAASNKSHMHTKEVEDDRLFPFLNTTAYMMWRGALKKAKMDQRDKSTNIRIRHPHVLRKFFRTRLGSVIPVDVVEALMGHEGYLTEVYRRYSMEDLVKFYKQGEHALLIFTEAAEVSRLRQEVDERNKALQTLVNGVTAENLEMKSQVAELRLKNVEVVERLGKMEKLLERILEEG